MGRTYRQLGYETQTLTVFLSSMVKLNHCTKRMLNTQSITGGHIRLPDDTKRGDNPRTSYHLPRIFPIYSTYAVTQSARVF